MKNLTEQEMQKLIDEGKVEGSIYNESCLKCDRKVIYHMIYGRFKCSGCNRLVTMCICDKSFAGE